MFASLAEDAVFAAANHARGAARQRIERAASVEGKTVTAFIVANALDRADKTIDRHETVSLAHWDATRFFHALGNPPPPNDCLRAALEEHDRRVISR